MIVLSLFDGIACGMVALKRCGIYVDKYFASEIDSSAIKVATQNHPEIIEIGDVRNISYKDGIIKTDCGEYVVGKIDLMFGGSPCTNFSSIGYANGMMSGEIEILSLDQYLSLKESGADFIGESYLFWEYCRLLKEVCPKYFLLENVVMSKKWAEIITKAIGLTPIKINSSVVSAQSRPRLYWTNIPNVSPPEEKQIILKDILDSNADTKDVSECDTVQKALPRLQKKYGYIPEMFNAYNTTEITNKAPTLSRGSMVTSSCATTIFVKCDGGKHIVKDGVLDGIYNTKLCNGRYNLRKLSGMEIERLQTLPDEYTNGVSYSKRSSLCGNAWTVDVIAHIFFGLKT